MIVDNGTRTTVDGIEMSFGVTVTTKWYHRLLCLIGYHCWSWPLPKNGTVDIFGPIPDNATCDHCGTRRVSAEDGAK